MGESGLGSASALPPNRRPCSSNQPSGWLGGENHQKDCLCLPSPTLAARTRGLPSAVLPFRMSILAALGAKPASAWVSSFRLAWLAPIGANQADRVELLALISPTEPDCRARALGPEAVAMLGRLETRSSSLSVAPGASL